MPATAGSRSPRIALLDNTTNASYIFAKILRRSGYDADFIQQRGMPFNHQPSWEDVDVALPAGEAYAHLSDDTYWEDFERRLGWARPPWVIRPRATVGALARLPEVSARLARAMPAPLLPLGLGLLASSLPIVARLRDYDVVLALGPSAGIAYAAGRPYAVITMGWDIFSLPFMTTSRNPLRRARGHLQRRALADSLQILGMPSMDLEFLERLGLGHHLRPFPVPVDVDGYAAIEPGSRAEVFGEEVAARAEGKLLLFCPSRISFAEKGQDLLLRAFAQVRAQGVPAYLVLLAWGHEAARADALIRELHIEDDVRLLPAVFSKRRLIRALRLADIAPIQFILGGYGTLAREALAAGAPVVSSYDREAPQPHPPEDPAPIIAAATVPEIRDALLRLVGRGAREAAAARGREWARRQHQEAPLREVDRLLAELR